MKLKKPKNPIIAKIRASEQYEDWKYCVLMAQVKTYPDIPPGLQVHHIKSIAAIVEENNIKTMADALACKELWDVNNGMVLKSGEHNIIMQMSRKKFVSQGFEDFLLWWLDRPYKYYDWSKRT